MPRLANSVPRYCKHKASGQAVVTLCGKDFYLGPHGTKVSRAEYDRLVGEWMQNGRRLSTEPAGSDLTVVEVCNAYRKHANAYYVKNGKTTREAYIIQEMIRFVVPLYGRKLATEFGPIALKTVRQQMIDAGLCRSHINKQIGRLRRMFRWAAAEEMIPVSVVQALATVPDLRKGRTEARESEPVLPVADSTVEQTLLFLPTMIADMVRIQRLTGCRPDEVCSIRPCDIDDSGQVWAYRPASHKTEHHGRERVIFIGPAAQAILRPYLQREKTNYCFVPSESERKRNAQRREERQTKMTPSQAARRPKKNRGRPPGDRYDHNSYRRAIHRACDLAFPAPAPLAQLEKETRKAWKARLTPEQWEELKQWQSSHRWSPNQLRHAAATEIRKRFGLEAAQVTLGHANADVTQVYAERDLEKAQAIMGQVG